MGRPGIGRAHWAYSMHLLANPNGGQMRRIVVSLLALILVYAAIPACSRDGKASAETPGTLYRDAALTAPEKEAIVPGQASLAPLIKRLRPAVVNISTTTVTKHPGRTPGQRRSPEEEFFERFFGGPGLEQPKEFRGSSLGSGFVINSEGYILTNNHVVKDATDIRVRLTDEREFTATVVGKDAATDVALIKLKNPPKDLPTVVLGDSDALEQGDFVLALALLLVPPERGGDVDPELLGGRLAERGGEELRRAAGAAVDEEDEAAVVDALPRLGLLSPSDDHRLS